MRREPPITFRGALQILGHYDRPWLDRLDMLLGGVILASGAAPAVSFLFGWVDQKNEATALLRRALDAVSGRLTNTGGLARHELVVAAHTTVVLAAFLEALRFRMGRRRAKAQLADAAKAILGAGERRAPGERLVNHLYAAQVPAPSALRGFEENVAAVEMWAASQAGRVNDFLKGIGVDHKLSDGSFARTVSRRYRSDYLRLATAVPEFKVWSDLGEHAATRTALVRLEELLSRSVSSTQVQRTQLGDVNRAELTRPMVDVDIDGYGIDAVFPPVERIFLTPRFRVTAADRSARIGDEHWWEGLQVNWDLDAVLARHFSTPDSTRLPLLLLGHPGAGKSLLTKVLAARLPEAMYTVVRVPLRGVHADANVSTQIQEALDASTHGRVRWHELVDQSADTIRVVLLDGLDELLQATTNDRRGYLTDIAEFQRVESAMGKPVAVVVTSRTLVADRVRVPEGTPVLKLEEFDENQIREWLSIWHEVNSGIRTVRPELVLAQGELARQPLLLLMLTLYFADPDVSPTDAELSTLELYERLFDTYARREVTKKAGRALSPTEREEAVRTQLSRLSIAAMGMFNRGRQSITETELGADLAALSESVPASGRLLGEFFFVHAPEATAGEVQRGYEFLHATFAEYLVATNAVEVLADIAEGAYGRRRIHEPDDELLFTLLSHQPLAVQRPTLDFIEERFARMAVAERTRVRQTLELLILSHRHRRITTRYTNYRPQPPDLVRALAAYSANLVLLRLHLEPTSAVELTTLWPDTPNAWPAMMSLWEAGLDAEGYRAVLSLIERIGDTVFLKRAPVLEELGEINIAQLREDQTMVRRLRFGQAALGELVFLGGHEPHDWADHNLSVFLSLLLGYVIPPRLTDPPDSVPRETTSVVADVASSVLGLRCDKWGPVHTERVLRWLMRLRVLGMPSVFPLGHAEQTYPGLLDRLRADPDNKWTPEWLARLQDGVPERMMRREFMNAVGYLNFVIPDGRLFSPPDDLANPER